MCVFQGRIQKGATLENRRCIDVVGCGGGVLCDFLFFGRGNGCSFGAHVCLSLFFCLGDLQFEECARVAPL